MHNYKYVEFTDRTGHGRRVERTGKLYIVGDASDELISEFKMSDANSAEYGKRLYYTTWNDISGTGWELFSVTPCSFNNETNAYNHSGTVEHSYIFRKEL